jgi:hypothetical protein
VITAPDKESHHWHKVAGAALGVQLLLVAGARLSSRLEAGTSDSFFQFLGRLSHLVQLSCNRVEIPRRRSTRAIQTIEADHVLERLDGAKRPFCLDPYPVRIPPEGKAWVGPWIDYGRHLKTCTVAALILIGASPVAMFLVAMCWSSMLGWLSKQKLPAGRPTIGHIRFHNSGSCRAGVTLA